MKIGPLLLTIILLASCQDNKPTRDQQKELEQFLKETKLEKLNPYETKVKPNFSIKTRTANGAKLAMNEIIKLNMEYVARIEAGNSETNEADTIRIVKMRKFDNNEDLKRYRDSTRAVFLVKMKEIREQRYNDPLRQEYLKKVNAILKKYQNS